MFAQIHCFSVDDLNRTLNFLNTHLKFTKVHTLTFISTSKSTNSIEDIQFSPEVLNYIGAEFNQDTDNVGLYFNPDDGYLRIHIYKNAKHNPQNF